MVERLTRAEMRALVGPPDDATLYPIIGLGLTRAELAEARAWVENDQAMLNEGRRRMPAASGLGKPVAR